MNVKRLAMVLGIAVLGCSSTGHASSSNGPVPETTSVSAAPSPSGRPSMAVALSATVVLPRRTLRRGSSLLGSVIVRNDTGHVLKWTACTALFQVLLGNSHIAPTPAWTECARVFTIPRGTSSYPVPVNATYQGCVAQPQPGAQTCLPGPRIPPLPTGRYNAILFEAGNFVPAPPPIPVVVAR